MVDLIYIIQVFYKNLKNYKNLLLKIGNKYIYIYILLPANMGLNQDDPT